MNRQPRKTTQPKAFDIHRTLTSPSSAKVIASSKNSSTALQPGAELSPRVLTKEPTKNKTKPKRKVGWKRFLLVVLLIILIPVLIIGVWDYRNFTKASDKVFGSSNPAELLLPSTLKTDSNGRTNVLIVGYSADQPNHGGALLTDSIMIASLDKESKKGFTLSVPRDLYVDIPDYGAGKINEAYQAGEQQTFSEPGSFGGGMELLRRLVSDNFGIELHYYALVNYGAVRGTVDALGGVTVNVESPDPRGIHDPNFLPEEGGPLTLVNGMQELDGQTALRFSRARGATFGSYGFPQSDFNRTANQQKVFSAIKDELSWKLILDPRTNGKVFDSASSNIETNLELSEVLPLFRLFKSIPEGGLQPVNLREADGGINLLTGYQTPFGQSALIPSAGLEDFSEIKSFIDSLEN